MAENIDINVNANTQQAQRNLDTLKSKVQGLSDQFTKLTSVLAAFGALNLAAKAIQYADAISDLSDATGIAIQNVIGFTKAVQMAGGDTERAQQGLVKFVQTIGEAAGGSAGAQNAFASIGVSLQDLATLSEQDLLRRTIDGLGQITDKAERAKLQTELFGKALRGVSLDKLAESYGAAVDKSAKYADSVRKLAEVQDALDATIGTFKLELISVLTPLSDLARALNENQKAVAKFFEVLFEAGKWAALAASFLLVVRGALALVAAFRAGYAVITQLGTGIMGLYRALNTPLTRSNLIKNLEQLDSFKGKASAMVTAIGVPLEFIKKHLFGIVTAAGAAYGALKAFFGLGKADTSVDDAELAKLQRQQELAKQTAEKLREVEDAQKKLKQELANVTRGYELQNQQIITNINREAEYIKIGEEAAEVLKAQREIQDRAANTIKELQDRKAALKNDEKGLIPIIDEQIKKIQQQSIADQQRVKTAVEGLQTQRILEEDRRRQIEITTKAIEDQMTRYSAMGDMIRSARDKLAEARFEGEQQGRSPLERQFAQIQENARKAAMEAQRAFAEMFSGLEMTPELTAELAAGLERIAGEYKKIAEEQSKNLEASRTWAAGWKEAFDQYMDNASNAARKAGEVFSSITRNMESAIDRFVETGKFSFKDFARSVIQDMLKIELKAAASKILSGIFGGGGGSFLGSLFGFANGGNPPVNKPSIVGERGPELFIPKTPGTIVPNEMLGGAKQVTAPVTNNYYTYNIDAIDSRSVAQFFAENRRTMLGTIQLAQKELPYANK